MIAALMVFVLVVGIVLGVYYAARVIPKAMEERRLELRLHDITPMLSDSDESSVLKQEPTGPVPAIDRLIATSPGTASLSRLITQSGVQTTPGTIVLASLASAVLAFVLVTLFVRTPFVAPAAAVAGLTAPFFWLIRRRTTRVARFEEIFPDALDLMARAIRAGHAFQTSLGMVADEVTAPVGTEFKKTFEQQNFGLPLREALNGLADRMPLLDVRFFVTAVTIQRESGGNLSEILENLAHVVRERFKIRRQVRTHTAHGRFTGWVLLALPAFLAVALSRIAPDQMQLLFVEPMGRMMLAGAVVLQTIGYFWIRRVIKIEV
ncbi:MAG TPA: type II secretion system F family protein [Vicinamibacterales bacterium]